MALRDSRYPERLSNIPDPPVVLYIRGRLPDLDEEVPVGVVGTRKPTVYGLEMAEKLGYELTRGGALVVSGIARGLDAAALRGALRAGGPVVSVLGGGTDVYYPRENRFLYEDVAAAGALISEYPPGTEPRAMNFPARNRIIVGLSRGIVVAEAARKSGALITAHIAADEGREVYCVPGNIFERSSIGCHELIRTGAKLVDNVQDILEDKLQWQIAMQRNFEQPSLFAEPKRKRKRRPVIIEKPLPESELGQKIWGLLKQGPLSLEDITEQLEESIPVISMELLELQIQGYVDQDKAQRYFRL
jgi:DNA processing protein